jgi:hypothetical protein
LNQISNHYTSFKTNSVVEEDGFSDDENQDENFEDTKGETDAA